LLRASLRLLLMALILRSRLCGTVRAIFVHTAHHLHRASYTTAIVPRLTPPQSTPLPLPPAAVQALSWPTRSPLAARLALLAAPAHHSLLPCTHAHTAAYTRSPHIEIPLALRACWRCGIGAFEQRACLAAPDASTLNAPYRLATYRYLRFGTRAALLPATCTCMALRHTSLGHWRRLFVPSALAPSTDMAAFR